MDGEVQEPSAIHMPLRSNDETAKAIRLGIRPEVAAVTECRGTMARHLPFFTCRERVPFSPTRVPRRDSRAGAGKTQVLSDLLFWQVEC
jgi:hypothetical protein